MSVYKILTDPNPVLRQKSAPVKNINAGVLRVLENMRDTMYSADGIGLAAPQIGVSKRMIVVDPGENYLEIINPVIVSREGEQNRSEGCLSVPGKVGWCKRARKVKVTGLNSQGETIDLEAEGILALVLQHEIDHLDGILFPDIAFEVRVDEL
ncbi:MAG: peptide deformylase [Syntrophomonas sp.]|nr:peptide deformylase [Syntrophomonas sp.]